jgi:peroxiredoxin Q/BCP
VADSPSAAPTANTQLDKFSAPMTGEQTFELQGRPAKYTVLYFYPKDNTPGCTTEAMAFRDHHDEITALGAAVYGISRDSLRSHEGFKAKLGLPFELISDPEEAVCTQFDVMKMKNMYGAGIPEDPAPRTLNKLLCVALAACDAPRRRTGCTEVQLRFSARSAAARYASSRPVS